MFWEQESVVDPRRYAYWAPCRHTTATDYDNRTSRVIPNRLVSLASHRQLCAYIESQWWWSRRVKAWSHRLADHVFEHRLRAMSILVGVDTETVIVRWPVIDCLGG